MHTVLIVEDDPDSQEALAEILQLLGYRVRRASHASAAIELWRREEALSLALCDLSLPDMSGLSLVRVLRAMRPYARIALITGYDTCLADDEKRALDGLFRKPISMEQLIAFLSFGVAEHPPAV